LSRERNSAAKNGENNAPAAVMHIIPKYAAGKERFAHFGRMRQNQCCEKFIYIAAVDLLAKGA